MTALKRYAPILFLMFLTAAAALFLPRWGVTCRAVEPEDEPLPAERVFPENGGSLASGEYVLQSDETVTNTLIVESGRSVTIDLNGCTLSASGGSRTLRVNGSLVLKDGKGGGTLSGRGVRVNGEMTMTSGMISGNTAEDGCVYIDSEGRFTMTGGSVTGNTAEEIGGGVLVRGALTLGGSARIAGNTGRDGKQNNVYLPEGKEIEVARGFAGEVGITLENAGSGGKRIAQAVSAEGFVADDLSYAIVEDSGELLFMLSPLETLRAEYHPGRKLFPLTDPQVLREELSLTYFNANGVPYPEDCVQGYTLQVIEYVTDETGEIVDRYTDFFSLGKNEVLVTALGQGGESASAKIEAEVTVPALERIELTYQQTGTAYFDTNPNDLYGMMNFSLVGHYEDGVSRTILRTPEETSGACGANYIIEHYEIEIDLSYHPEGRAEGRVKVLHGEIPLLEENFSVAVSRRVIDLSSVKAVPVNLSEGETELDPRRFTPSLPSGVQVEVLFLGEPLEIAALESGVYAVDLRFFPDEREHYELVGEPPKGKLVVFEHSRSASSNGIEYTVSREGGISPEWEFLLTDETRTCKAQLSDDLKLMQAVEITFFPGESTVSPEALKISIKLSDELTKDELRLFRVRADGSLEEIALTREGDFAVFEASDLLESQFILASASNMTLYVVLAVCFGVLCAAGAAGLLWYFISKKKLDLKR